MGEGMDHIVIHIVLWVSDESSIANASTGTSVARCDWNEHIIIIASTPEYVVVLAAAQH